MADTKHSSPRLVLKITDEAYDRAVQSSSGGCLIADAIRNQYPRFTKIVVDMATVRVTDRKAGLRYTYLTPEPAQQSLLHFDQGWVKPFDEVRLKRAVKILPVRRARTGPASIAGVAERRAARITELEAKEAAGVLSRGEKIALTRSRNPKPAPERPTSNGAMDIKVVEGGSSHGAVIFGGRALPQGTPHPNLLRSQNRHFGAKTARPGLAWEKAVAEAAEISAEAMIAERFGTPPTE
jgi:hypothetical protein